MTKWEELLALLSKGERLFISLSGTSSDPPHVWTSDTFTNFTFAQFKALKQRGYIFATSDNKFWRSTWLLTVEGKNACRELTH